MDKEKYSQRLVALWVVFAFALWCYAFRGYLSSRFELISDQLSYYDHTRFLIENLRHGIYPLWDPFWINGAPNDFFLRRIGAFNPFYLIILLFKAIGISYTLSYLWFLAIYYWSGMIAFYLLLMRIYNDRFIAYAGYLILLFSALGTRLFDSYMMLVTVPLIWFFYFLLAFSQTPRKHLFMGLTLSLMILLGTYIPLYFLTIFGFFMLLFVLICFKQIPGILNLHGRFINKNKALVLFSFLALILVLLPAMNFVHDTAHGRIIFPVRHGSADAGQGLTVPHQTLDWGAVEDLMYSSYFSNLRLYKFAVVYVPFFAFIALLLGLISRINRRMVFISLLGILLFGCMVPHGLPFYDFFYQHLFFLKYFRNLHFFIWFFLIPLFVVLVMEHWNMFKEMISTEFKKRSLLLIYVVIVHLAAFSFVWYRKDAIASTYIMILLSLIFWSLLVLKRLKMNAAAYALLTLTILIQPWETYHYFALKAVSHQHPYAYDFPYTRFQIKDTVELKTENIPATKENFYYVLNDYNNIYQNTDFKVLKDYLKYRLILVDRTQNANTNDVAAVLSHNFITHANTVLVANQSLGPFDPNPSAHYMGLENATYGLKVLSFDANHLRLTLDLPYKKFLIYNDNYAPNWKVYINHNQVPLYEVNGAFKGAWVPAGKSEIEFSYGLWWQYAMNILLSLVAIIFLIGIIRTYKCTNN